ncbi:Adenosine deaminase 2-A [Datura stramonium]|uniref:Adenosine deaminase 2-A n=1 Tax=Datura stramonium TaxID=4076 RepID=A0ABS8V6Y9_DATST|nr:Adenosine deaminase 2-A [Datura stramonium]
MTELSGYNSKREEFEIEYDNDAEQMLADMEFKETDSNAERELKLRVLRIYSKRLDERGSIRKDFILERNLLHPDLLRKTSPRRRGHAVAGVFMRFNSKRSMRISLGACRGAPDSKTNTRSSGCPSCWLPNFC